MPYSSYPHMEKYIKNLFYGCEVQIENSVIKVTVWHQEACQVMQNSYPKWWNF